MKSFFPQSVAVLSRRPLSLSELKPLLPEHPFLKENPGADDWTISG